MDTEITMAAIPTCAEEAVASFAATYKVKNGKGYLAVKRVMDILMAIVMGVVLFIPMVILGIAIWLESPGPVIFTQERLGLNGKPYTMYKFRSMYNDAEKDGPQWAKVGDPRCTKIGRVIRLFHVDELPQLWNVLKGDMSMVGPRPEREFFYQAFDVTIPEYRARLLVKPGLTGLTQINGQYDLTAEERLVYDLEYMEKRSLWMDIVCIWKTVAVVFNHKGAR